MIGRASTSAVVLAFATLWITSPVLDPNAAFAQRDAIFSEIAIQHLQDVALGSGDWRATPLGWPLADSVTQTDWMLGEALVGLPLRVLAIDPMRVYTIVAILGLFVTAFACDRLAAALLGEGVHTWVAGIAGGLAPGQVLHAQHVNLVWHAFGPLAVLGLYAGIRRDRPVLAFCGGAAAFVAVHFGAYVGMHALFVVAVALPFLLSERGSRRAWAAAAAGAAIGALSLVPIARVYLAASEGGRFEAGELAKESVDLGRPTTPDYDPLWPGPVRALLCVAGVASVPRDRRWALVALLGIAAFALACGPFVQWGGRPLFGPGPWGLLVGSVPALGAMRAPARWLAVTALAGSLFAAAGARRALAWRPATAPIVATGILLGLLAETRRPTFLRLSDTTPNPAYSLVTDSAVAGPLLDRLGATCGEKGEQKLRAALVHRRPLVGGLLARDTPDLMRVNRAANQWPRPDGVAWLRAHGVRLVFDHPPLPPAPAGLACEERDGHRLCVLPP